MDTLLALDRSLFLCMNGDMGVFADTLFWVASGKLTWIPLYLFILYLVYRRWGWKTAVAFLAFVALSVILADQVCNIFKYGLKKLRPVHTEELEGLVHTVRGHKGGLYGTFSAHAATSFAIAAFTMRYFRNIYYTLFIVLWALFVSYSRIYLGAHYPMDILLGSITGFIFGWYGYSLFVSPRFSKWYKS